MAKIWYFDVETTGLDAYRNDIIQLAGIIEIDGKIEDEFEIKIKPIDPNRVDESALKVNGITREQLDSDEYILPRTAYSQLCKTLEYFVDKFDRNDKFIPCGYNVDFDLRFLEQFFRKNGDNFFGSFVDRKTSKDPFPVLRYLKSLGSPALKNAESLKLAEVCRVFGIELTAHNAKSDIRATRELVKILDRGLSFEHLKEPKSEVGPHGVNIAQIDADIDAAGE